MSAFESGLIVPCERPEDGDLPVIQGMIIAGTTVLKQLGFVEIAGERVGNEVVGSRVFHWSDNPRIRITLITVSPGNAEEGELTFWATNLGQTISTLQEWASRAGTTCNAEDGGIVHLPDILRFRLRFLPVGAP